jgi:hypothetical protein
MDGTFGIPFVAAVARLDQQALPENWGRAQAVLAKNG